MDSEITASATHREARGRNGKRRPRSLATSERGIRSGADFATFMSSLISDIIARRVTPDIANAACNAGGKLLKVVEMQYKYGEQVGPREPVLTLAEGVGERSEIA